MRLSKLIAIDSNIFIYHFQAHPIYLPLTIKVFKAIEMKSSKAVTSILTLTEVLGYKQSAEIINQLQQAFEEVVNLSLIEVNKSIAKDAAKIRRDYDFKLADAIQLATAMYAKAKVFITNDEGFKKFKEIKVILLSELN